MLIDNNTVAQIARKTAEIFAPLSEEELRALCFCVYIGPDITKYQMSDYYDNTVRLFGEKSYNQSKQKSLERSLENKGFVIRNFYSYNRCIIIYNKYIIPAICALLLQHHDWLETFMRTGKHISRDIDNLISSLNGILVGRHHSELYDNLVFDRIDAFTCFNEFEEYRPLSVIIPNDYIIFHIKSSIYHIEMRDYLSWVPFLEQLVQSRELNKEDSTICNEALAYVRYIAYGTFTQIAKPKSFFGDWLLGIYHANKGDFDTAADYLAHGFRYYNKEQNITGLYEQLLPCYYQMICFARSEKYRNKLDNLSNKCMKSNLIAIIPGYILSIYFTSTKGPNKSLFEQNYRSIARFKCANVNRLFHFIQKYLDVEAETGSDEQPKPELKLLRHEMRSMLNLSADELTELNALYGEAPVLEAEHRMCEWEILLNKVLTETKETPTSTEKKTRIAYIIQHERYVDIREQTILKNGTWSVGKSISESRLREINAGLLNGYDKKIFTYCIAYKSFHICDVKDFLPLLIGCDRVFTNVTGKGLVRVDVDEEKPYVILDKNKDGFFFASNLEPSDVCYPDSRAKILRKSTTHYTVIQFTDKQRKAFNYLFQIKNIPFNAEPTLRSFMQQVNSKLGIHTSSIEGSENIKVTDGEPQVVIRIYPERNVSFVPEISIKAHRNGKETVTVGKGAAIIIDEIDGERYQVKRKLNTEKKIYGNIVQYLEDATDKDIHSMSLTGQQMLDLMQYVKDSDDYVIEWPQGEQLKLSVAQEKEWSLRMKTAGRWFEVEGNVTVDMSRVLSLAELLEAIANSDGKYVRIGDNEFMLISENIRKQLERLDAMAVNERGKIKLSPLQAAVGSDIFGGDGIVKANKAWNDLRKKIEDSYSQRVRIPSTMQAVLRYYQFDGLQWMKRLTEWGGGACLADDMGLGKTVQAIAYMLLEAKNGVALVVAPASVLPNWRNELERFAPSLNVKILNNAVDRKDLIDNTNAGDVVLTTYGIMVSEDELVTSKEWHTVILDEAHAIKNRDTKMSKVAMKLQAKNRIAMTGTPIQNHLGELWNLFQFLNPGLLGSYEQFNKKFITEIEQNEDRNAQRQLKRIIAPFMLRRTKKEVADELPDKTEIKISVDLTPDETAIYESMRARAEESLKQDNKVDVKILAQITQLRQAACTPRLVNADFSGESSKLTAFIGLVEEICAGGNKVIVFSQFTSFLRIAKEYLDNAKIPYLYFDGSTNIAKREQIIQQFRNDDCQLFLISLKAGGLGLNLTEANYVIHLDPWWNPAIEQQATDRAYRIGQKQKVTVYHLISAHTIEEKILRMHTTKRDLADQLLEGTNVSHKLTAKDLLDMLEG